MTLQAHGQAITRIVALAEQVRLRVMVSLQLLMTCVQVKRSRPVHQVNTLDEVQQQQQQQPRLTILLSNTLPTSSPLPPGYQPPSCTVSLALAHHVTAAAAAAAAALCAARNNGDARADAGAAEPDTRTPSVRLGRRMRSGRPLLAACSRAKVEE